MLLLIGLTSCKDASVKEEAAVNENNDVPAHYKTFQQDEKSIVKMQWFEEAKLGIFIHWGIYAVNGTSESWAFFN